MPNTQAARKTMRQDAKRRARNRANRSILKSLIKKYLEVVATQDVEKSELAFRGVAKRLDQAAAKKTIHKNKAARLKSRLSKRLPKKQAT